MTTPAPAPKQHKPRPCPICNKMSLQRYHPFCSGRCANIDLHRWLGENYRLPSREAPDFDDGDTLRDDDRED